MARSKLTWKKSNRGNFVDIESDDGHWVIGTGLDEYERKRGKPYLLLYRVREGAPQKRIDAFAREADAKAAALDLE